jgi:beta-mannosidase
VGQLVPASWIVNDELLPGEENHLLVVVERAAELDVLAGNASQARALRGRGPYGWPEYARLVSVGLSGAVSLVITGMAWFDRLGIYTNISLDRTEAAASLVCEFKAVEPIRAIIHTEITQDSLPVGTVEDQVRIFGETAVVQSITMPRVQLWWSNGLGRQPVYQARFILADLDGKLLDHRTLPFGVRQMDASRCDGAPPDSPNYCLEVNRRKVWLKGWEWASADQLTAALPPERYARLLRLAKDAGANLLRVPGTAGQESTAFYSQCDRLGLMVWQEFPLAGNAVDGEPPTDRQYLTMIEEQAPEMVARRRTHPSLVYWSAGSGLTLGPPDFEALGSEHPALAELRTAVETEDPQRFWFPSTPLPPDALPVPTLDRLGRSPDWGWRGLEAHPRHAEAQAFQLHVGFGAESLAHEETLQALFVDQPPVLDPEHEFWQQYPALAPHLEQLRAAFGPVDELSQAIRASQMLQALALQYGVEAARRRQGRSAGVIPAQFNEPRPNALGAAAVDFYDRPKPAYYAVKRAYRSFHVSAAFRTYAWAGEAQFQADIWLHTDGVERSLLNVVAVVVDLHGRELYQENLAGEVPENGCENVGDLYWRFPAAFAEAFVLFLEVIDEEGETLARNHYLFSRASEPAFQQYLSAPTTSLELRRTATGLEIENTGSAVALGIQLDAGEALIEDGSFPLVPGGIRQLGLSAPAASVTLQAWNASNQTFGATTDSETVR